MEETEFLNTAEDNVFRSNVAVQTWRHHHQPPLCNSD